MAETYNVTPENSPMANVTLNADDVMNIYSGGTATEATVKTGGKLTVESSGFCDDATVEMGGNLYVISSGGTAAGTYIGAMGNLAVSKGGTAYGTTVGAGGFLTVGTKGIAEGADVNGFLNVLDGGTASNVTVNEGAVVYVQSKGTGSDVSVDYGGILEVLSGGRLKGATVDQGGSATIHADVMASNVVVDGGKVTVMSDGWAYQSGVSSNTIVQNGGRLIVSGGGYVVGAAVSAGGHVTVESDATFSSATVVAADVTALDGACVSRLNLESGGILNVVSGGKAEHINVSAGGVLTGILREASELIFYGGTLDLNIAGVSPDSEALVDEISFLSIMPVAEDYLCTLTVSDTQAEGAYKLIEGASGFDTSKAITVKDTLGTTLGTLTVNGGSTTIGGVNYTLAVTTEDVLTVTIAGGVDLTGDLNSDFELTAGMVGSSVNILEGGRLIVDGGGSADVVTVNSGGFLYVYNGGKATQIKENGGYVGENDGADVTFVSNSFGGYVYDSPDEWATIHSGTTGTDLTVGNDGVILVYSGGTAVDTTVAADGNLGVYGGGKLTGNIKFETGANVTVEDGAIVDFDLTKTTAGDPALVNNLSFFGTAAVTYTLTVDGTEADGDYKLAEGATGFDKTITVKDTLGTTLGTLTVAGGKTTIDGKDYILTLTGTGSLGVTLGAGGGIPDTTPPDKPIPEASSELPTNGYVTVTATFSDDSVLRECSKDGENWVEYQSSGLTFVENGKAYFRATDGAGNVSDIAVYEVTNIDKVAPTISYITPSTTAPAASVTVTASFDDDVSLASTQYRIGVGAWQDYTTGVTVTENTTVYFKAVDAAGNESEVKEYEVTNIIITGDITGKEYVSSGGMASGATVKAGGSLNILSGGVARDTLINAGGKLTVVKGGKLTGSMTFEDTASVTVQQYGIVDFDISELAPSNAALVNNLSVIQGKPTYTLTVGASQAEGTYTLAGGASSFSSSITVKDTLGTELDKFYSVNQSLIIGGMVYTLTLTDDVLAVTIAGAGGGVDLTGDLDTTSGLAAGMVGSSVNILDGGNLEVFEGGFTSQTTVNSGGDLVVSAGGSADVVTVNFGGDLFVRNGGIATLVKENGGYASVNDGATATFVSNSFGGYVYNNADDWCTIHSGTTGTDLTVGNDGKITVYDGGVASQTTVNSNGDLAVSEGGVADVVTVNFGGDLYVLNGGVATLVKENGGYVGVDDGATATFVSNSFGGYVYNNADDWCTIHDGTTGSNLTAANKGRIYVYSGGIASDTTVNDKGIVEGNSGGLINGAVVNSGGSLLIYNGAKLTGQMTFVAGAEVIPFVGSILDFDLTQTAPDAAALVNDLSILMGTPGYTLTVDGTQASGAYKLAGNVASFNKIISVKSVLGEDYGYLTFGGTLSTSFADYTLALADDNTLTVDVVSKAPADTTPPDKPIPEASSELPTNGYVTVTATFSDDSVLRECSKDGENWVEYQSSGLTFVENGKAYFRATDGAGNVSDIAVYEVTNIDKVAPTITGITPSTTEPAASVTVTADFYDAVELASKQYNLGGGAWQDYDPAVGVTVTENTTVNFLATDTAGNETTESYEVTNIQPVGPDTTPPEVVNVMADITDPTNGNVTVTADFTDNVAVAYRYYTLSLYDMWQDYPDGGVVVTENNTTVYFEAVDTSGNTSDVVTCTVTNIDKEAPTITGITPSTTDPAESVTVTADFYDAVELASKQYNLGGGAWQDYDPAVGVTVTENTTVNFLATDTAGNETTESYEVTNIQPVGPENAPDNGWNDYLYKKGKPNKGWNTDENIAGFASNPVSGNDEIRLDVPGTIDTEDGYHNMFGNNGENKDAGDVAKISVETAAKLTFTINSTAAGTFYVYEEVKTETKHKQIKVGKVAVTKNKPAPLTVCLTAGEGKYYVAMAAKSVKKKGSEGLYNVNVVTDRFFVDADSGANNEAKDSWQIGIGRGSESKPIILDGNSMKGSTEFKNFVGFSDNKDYAKLDLASSAYLKFNVTGEGDGKAKFTIWKQAIGKTKRTKVTSVTIPSKGAYAKTTSAQFLNTDKYTYYVSMECTNASKGKEVYYNVEVADGAAFFDSADDGKNNALYNKSAKEFYEDDGTTHHFERTNIDAGVSTPVTLDIEKTKAEGWRNFVGYGDAADYAKIELKDGGKLSFDLEFTGDATFTVYRKGEKKGKETLETIQTTKLSFAKDGGTKTTAELLNLDAGEYYISMTAKSTKANSSGSVFYNVSATLTPQPSSALEMPMAATACADSVQDKLFGESVNGGFLASL